MFSEIYKFKDCKTRRASSFDRTGGNQDFIKFIPGETKTIAEIKGAGIIKHIWITISCTDPMFRRNIIIRMYWDGEENPSAKSPIGDFFGQGWGENYNFASLPIAAAPAQGKAFNCYFPMPFSEGAVISIENQSDCNVDGFYYYVDYEAHESIAHDAGGINYYVDNPGPMWYGEGDDMWMIDGEAWPGSLHGTGTEDFFNGSWCPSEIYQHPYFGYARVSNKLGWMGRTHCYRYFIQDPIYFTKSLHASIEHGHANTLTLDIATVAYWYQTEYKVFPAMPAKDKRQNMPEIWVTDIHRWACMERVDGCRKTVGK